MRWLGRLLVLAAFVALICLARISLVVGPEEPMEAPKTLMPEAACLLTAERDGTETPAAAEAHADSRLSETALLTAAAAEEPGLTICGGNGWPLRSRSWFRTVYLACPPEGSFG